MSINGLLLGASLDGVQLASTTDTLILEIPIPEESVDCLGRCSAVIQTVDKGV